MEGSMNLTPDCSTPSSTSPIDVLGLLNDDDDFEGSAGERSRRPSDEDFHLPLFKRGERSDIFTRPTQEVKGPCFHLSSNVSAFPGSDLKLSDDFSNENDYNRRFMSNKSMASFCDNLMKSNHSQIDDMLLTQPSLSLPAIGEERGVPKSPDGDQELLSQAVSIIQAMNLIGKNPSSDITLGSQQALANIAALAQIGESEKGQIRGPNLSRQVSFPPEAYQPPPVAMYNKPPQMNGYQQQSRTLGDIWKNGSSYARNFIAPATNNGVSFSNAPYNNVTNGFGMVGMGGRTPLRPSFSLPNGYPEPPKVTGDYGDLMQIRCKFGQLGGMQGQFNAPHGFCIGRFEEIVVADTHNHRVQVFDKNGTFQFMFGRAGKDEGCLWHPRKVAVLRHNGHFVVCDRGNERSRMQLFNERGMFVHRISIRFVDIVAGLATTSSGQIVVVDSVRPTIFILDPVTGGLVTYFECAEFMSEPSDIAVYNDDFYVCDFKGHSVVVVNSSGQFLRKIALEGVSLFPNGIDISDEGDILVGDSHGNQFHVAIYNRFGEFVSHFHCPHVKVSRCCGLKITSEGYIITLAKNNHHVLVLNTLFVA